MSKLMKAIAGASLLLFTTSAVIAQGTPNTTSGGISQDKARRRITMRSRTRSRPIRTCRGLSRRSISCRRTNAPARATSS